MLLELLQRPHLLMHERATLAWMLGRPWCWPEEEALAARAIAMGFSRPREPTHGETAVVTVSEGRRRSCLYRFGPRVATSNAVPFAPSAQRALDRVNALVSRSLGALRPSELAVRHAWSAELLARDGDGLDAVVDGPSFGLGMALAMASVFLRRPVPSAVLASAEVDADGCVGPVGGIDVKLAHVAGNALGVRRVLVATAQLEDARRTALGLARPLELVGVSTLQEALEVALEFRFRREDLGSLFERSDDAREVASRVFDMVVDGSRTALDWQAVGQIAETVRNRLEIDAATTSVSVAFDDHRLRAQEQLSIAQGIVERHAGYGTLLPWPRDEALRSMPRPRRLRLLAHLVQSAAEWSDHDTRGYIERAKASLAPREEQTECDLVLCGAIGRALASIETDLEALVTLEDAVLGWIALGAHAEASFAVAESIRVAALLRDMQRLERLVTQVAPLVIADPRTSDVGVAHVAFAAGRAEALAGRPECAVAWLTSGAGVEWTDAPRSLARARSRWLARALAAAGELGEAAVERATLERHSPGESHDEQLLLARLDAAVSADEATEPLLTALSTHARAGRETIRILARRPDAGAAERATVLADRYRY